MCCLSFEVMAIECSSLSLGLFFCQRFYYITILTCSVLQISWNKFLLWICFLEILVCIYPFKTSFIMLALGLVIKSGYLIRPNSRIMYTTKPGGGEMSHLLALAWPSAHWRLLLLLLLMLMCGPFFLSQTHKRQTLRCAVVCVFCLSVGDRFNVSGLMCALGQGAHSCPVAVGCKYVRLFFLWLWLSSVYRLFNSWGGYNGKWFIIYGVFVLLSDIEKIDGNQCGAAPFMLLDVEFSEKTPCTCKQARTCAALLNLVLAIGLS